MNFGLQGCSREKARARRRVQETKLSIRLVYSFSDFFQDQFSLELFSESNENFMSSMFSAMDAMILGFSL
jgi:hypothetical protein